MKTQTCCFSGHRTIPAGEYPAIRKRLEFELGKLICEGVRYFGAGGARGFDSMAALAVLKLKIGFPHIRLVLVLPCKGQTKGWNSEGTKIYNQIRDKADKVVYLSENYYSGCMQKRNRHIR